MKDNILIDKSILFAARIIKLHDFLIKNKKGLTIAKQKIRSRKWADFCLYYSLFNIHHSLFIPAERIFE